MKQKRLFNTLFILLTFILVTLPFLVTFNDFLARIIEKVNLYTWIQAAIVPFEVRMVKILTIPFAINFVAYANGMLIKGVFLQMSWNCIGWQSLFLLLITLFVGLSGGNYTFLSMIKTIGIGLLGIFWVNLLRLVVVIILFAYFRPLYGIVYHDYLAAFVTVVFLFVFWWFSYSFVLEERQMRNNVNLR